jgi:arginyl-tRNA--protein-N-Asp/Glu arginylyltransferase
MSAELLNTIKTESILKNYDHSVDKENNGPGRRKKNIQTADVAKVLTECESCRSIRQIASNLNMTEFYVRRIIRENADEKYIKMFKLCKDYSKSHK